MINVKKAIISLFQANFKGTKEKIEADVQSLHKSKYRFVVYTFWLVSMLLLVSIKPLLICQPLNTCTFYKHFCFVYSLNTNW